MTSDQFRRNAELVSGWRDLLANNPVVAQVLVVLKDEKPDPKVPPGSDALDRAAALAKLEQHDFDVNLLLSLAEPEQPDQPPEEPTWGVDTNQFRAVRPGDGVRV